MKLSRKQLAEYLLENPTKVAMSQVAGYLVSEGRSKEVELVVREVESQLHGRGRTVARVSSARKLDAEEQKNVIKMLKAQNNSVESVEIINEIDPSLLGGVIVRTPETEVDVSIRGRLMRMKRV